jgi:protein-tyrosine phosphatase
VRGWLGALLASRPIRLLRRWTRDLHWHAEAQRLRNPEPPRPLRSVLFVCKGNICRSPFAEHIAHRLAREAGLEHIRFLSAGITANQAAACPLEAVEAAQLFDVSLNGHVPTRLSQALVDEADLVVVMEAGQLDAVARHWPSAAGKLWLLPLLDPAPTGAYERCHLVDPYGQPPEAYGDCYTRVERTVRELLRRMTCDQSGSHLG